MSFREVNMKYDKDRDMYYRVYEIFCFDCEYQEKLYLEEDDIIKDL